MRQAGCKLEQFRRVQAPQIILPWKLLQYNYRNHRRILVIDGRIGFTGGYGISDDWLGDGRTPNRWRDTNVRVEGPAVKYLQAAFTDSWLETTGNILGGGEFFPPSRGDAAKCRSSSSEARRSAAAFRITCSICYRSPRRENRSSSPILISFRTIE